MGSCPIVSVIVPTYREWANAKKCIDALDKQTYPGERMEIIVVNNDPIDVCPLNSLPDNVTVINESIPGSYAARNAGLKTAKGEIVAFTDADCKPLPNWIQNAVEVFKNNPGISRIGGNIELTFASKKLTVPEIYEKACAFRQQDHVKKGTAITANMVSYKYVFDEIGDFRHDLMSGGDVEWGRRAEQAGYRIAFASNCVVLHPARSEFHELKQKTIRIAGGNFTMQKNLPLPRQVFCIMLGVIPPIRSAWRLAFNEPDLSVFDKLVVFFLRYYLRLLGSKERILLLAGKKAERK